MAAGISAPSAGEAAPVDTDRVTVIRKAIEQGRYPVVPTRIADAMIAAGFLLRTKE
jgi:negative regulator of flagellin synthesis FlgM